jgi:hypothetical protein
VSFQDEQDDEIDDEIDEEVECDDSDECNNFRINNL